MNQNVSEAVQNLLDRALIMQCEKPPFIVNPLTVSVQSSGKKRLILDLRVVNKHLWKQSVKYEDIKVALTFLQKGFFMVKFDLTSAYHFVEMFEPHTEFLGFSWRDEYGNAKFYKFLVLQFGLSSACYLFTKLTRPLVSKWRGEGKLVTMFLDDGFGCGKNYDQSLDMGRQIKQDLLSSGFVPNHDKSVWIPVQVLPFLGTVLNFSDGLFPSLNLDFSRSKILLIVYWTRLNRVGVWP